MNRLVELALRQRMLVLTLLIGLIMAGVVGFANLNIEAYPDPVPPMVEVLTQSNGTSAEEMERNVTTPIEVAIAGLPHLTAVRSISLFGLSDVKIQFTYDVTFREAEQPDRRNLSLSRRRPARLFGDGSENAAGLGASAAFQAAPRGGRRDRLGRQITYL